MTPSAREQALREFEAFLEAGAQDQASGRVSDPARTYGNLPSEEARRIFLELVEEYRSLAEDLAAGPVETEIGGYRLGSRLGRGGMGEVFEARAPDGTRVAIKLLPDELSFEPSAVARLEREVEALTKLDHPHIVRHLGHGRHGRRPYLVLEHLGGGTLERQFAEHAVHKQQARLNAPLRDDPWVQRLAGWILEVLEALAAAHAVGVIHRDVKPANVLLGEDGRARLADFGLAHVELSPGLTSTGKVLGTPGYLAPERLLDPEAAHAPPVDLYSVATMLFEGLAGTPPYPGGLGQVLSESTVSTPSLAIFLGAAADPALEALMERGLATDPRQRYSSASEFAGDLRAWLAGGPVGALRGRRRRRLSRRLRAHPIRWLLVAMLTIALGALAGRKAVEARRERRLSEERLGVAAGVVQRHADLLIAYRELLAPKGGGSRNDWSEAAMLLQDEDPRQRAQSQALEQAAQLLREGERLLIRELDGPLAGEARADLLRLGAAHAELLSVSGDRAGAVAAWSVYAKRGGTPRSARISLSTRSELAAVFLSRYDRGAPEARWPLVERRELTPKGREVRIEGLAPGSYLLELRRQGQDRWIRVPVHLHRGDAWSAEDFALPSDAEIGAAWEYLPPGSFIAGGDPRARASEPRTLRRIEEGFFMRRTEVTVAEYKRFLRDHHRDLVKAGLPETRLRPRDYPEHTPEFGEYEARAFYARDAEFDPGNDYFRDDRAIHSISLLDAKAYVAWLNERDPEWTYALPSADQWEYAARGADGRMFPWGDRMDWELAMTAAAKLRATFPDAGAAMRPGVFPGDRSPFEILDLGGNVGEFCEDAFHLGPAQAPHYLVRGGQQDRLARDDYRAAARWETGARVKNFDLGIRLVRTPRDP